MLGAQPLRQQWESAANHPCIPSELWSVENNLNLANMDWEEFVEPVGEDDAFRGFSK